MLGTVDAVVFTAGVGQHSPELRAAALAGLERLGIVVDDVRNEGRVAAPASVSRTAATSPCSSSPPTRSARSPARPSRSSAGRDRAGGLGAQAPRDAGVELGRLGERP